MNRRFQLVLETVEEENELQKLLPELHKEIKKAAAYTAKVSHNTGDITVTLLAASIALGSELITGISWIINKISEHIKDPEDRKKYREKMLNKIEKAKQKALDKHENKKSTILSNVSHLEAQLRKFI